MDASTFPITIFKCEPTFCALNVFHLGVFKCIQNKDLGKIYTYIYLYIYIYICMYVCIYICVSITLERTKGGIFDVNSSIYMAIQRLTVITVLIIESALLRHLLREQMNSYDIQYLVSQICVTSSAFVSITYDGIPRHCLQHYESRPENPPSGCICSKRFDGPWFHDISRNQSVTLMKIFVF